MKKIISLLLVLALVVGMAIVSTGCGSEPYAKYDLTEYIKLPDYNKYKVDQPKVEITEADIQKEILSILEDAASTKEVKEGTVKKGDSVTISYEGKLKDGTTSDGMKSTGTTITLGSAGYIDGFEEGLYGATIGKKVTLNLKFPDPYGNNKDLAGKDVTFEVTVLSKNVKILPEFNEAFVKKNSDFKSVAAYKKSLKEDLEREEYDEQLHKIKGELYSKIVENTTALKYPEKEVKAQEKVLDEEYKAYAESYGYSWEDFLKAQEMDQEGYDKMIKMYAQEVVKQEMVIYLIGQKEELTVTDEEYDKYLDTLLESSGYKNEKEFKETFGMSLKKYAEKNNLDRDLLLTKELDVIYDRLADK